MKRIRMGILAIGIVAVAPAIAGAAGGSQPLGAFKGSATDDKGIEESVQILVRRDDFGGKPRVSVTSHRNGCELVGLGGEEVPLKKGRFEIHASSEFRGFTYQTDVEGRFTGERRGKVTIHSTATNLFATPTTPAGLICDQTVAIPLRPKGHK